MTGNSVVDARRMFKHACAFSGCARFCTREPWDVEHRLPDYSVAGIVNSAFACEVFIKSLLIYRGVSIEEIVDARGRGEHKLRELWTMLENRDPQTADLVKQKIQELFNFEDDEKFYEMLDNVSNAFVYWRYIYEKSNGKIHVNFLNFFRELLKEVCCEKFYDMSWNEYTKGAENHAIG